MQALTKRIRTAVRTLRNCGVLDEKRCKPSHAVEDQKGRAERGLAALDSKSDVEDLWQGWSLPPALQSPDTVSAWAPTFVAQTAETDLESKHGRIGRLFVLWCC
jgi:hypothetical protein